MTRKWVGACGEMSWKATHYNKTTRTRVTRTYIFDLNNLFVCVLYLIVLVNEVTWDFFAQNFTKNGILCGSIGC